MTLRKVLAVALVLLVAAAVPVSAAPIIMSGCSMAASSGMRQASGCCPAGACDCHFEIPAERHLIGDLPSDLPALFAGGAFLTSLLPDFRAPLLTAPVPAATASPPPRKLYDVYSEYRV